MTYKEKLRPKGITPWARLKPFNYDRYSLSVSLAFAARIIICRLLKSNTLLETVPSWDQPVGLNKFYKKKKKKYACTLIRIVFEFESFEIQKQWIGSILYRACAVWCLKSQHGGSQLFSICRPGWLSFPHILTIARKTITHQRHQ